MAVIRESAVISHFAIPGEHQRRADRIPGERVSDQPVFVRIHVMNPETRLLNAIARNEVAVSIRKIRSVARAENKVPRDDIALRIPKMDTVATLGRRQIRVAQNNIIHDGAAIDPVKINAESAAFDPARFNPHARSIN